MITPTSKQSPNVSFIHPQLSQVYGEYMTIRDCLAGPSTIKDLGTAYLPRPNPEDTSVANIERYRAYKKRAVYYNVPRRTLHGLTGVVFSHAPLVEVPASLDSVVEDATGSGVSLEHEAHKLLSFTLSYSRGGVLVDYPDTGGLGTTAADAESGRFRPTITTYSPLEIINWRVFNDGARTRLSLVVLAEGYPLSDDGFELKTSCQMRVLSLVPYEGRYVYQTTVWRDTSPEVWDGREIPRNRNWAIAETYIPTDVSGKPLEDIPFQFVGSENNDSNVDTPSFYDLCELALSHYRNSADYEESCYQMGQPTYWFSGISSEYLKETLKGKISLGSRGGVPLPEGGNAGMLIAPANSMAFEALTMKERQMVALGAKLVEQKSVQRTATEARQDESSDTSILAACAKNVSAVITQALKMCCLFTGDRDDGIKYELTYDFNMSNLSSDERNQLITEFNAGLLTFSEVRAVLRKSGVASLDDDAATAAIDEQKEKQMALAVKASVGTSKDNDDSDKKDDKE